MLSIEDFKELAALAGERRLRIIQGGDPRLEPQEAEVLLWLADHLAERGFDLLSAVAAVANDPVRLACRFASGDLSRLVSVEPGGQNGAEIDPRRGEEGAQGTRVVAPLPVASGRRNSISAVSAPAGTLAGMKP